ncbi:MULTISPECIES: phosphonate ABC transporter, permease protein PhnE [unclassified Agarivorans]|uniref:phosphonate ABC transporter, permease protein PhnE n=1 Tax=unclassified Agarivorans TaxID=2636026 RepID=UPI0026E2749C|nr:MULTISPECIES: phosphonate ABC transporter, permease protein PhnE [unclassified Agarivorans]MDO6685889.1 phosphonate ABC transporter, permease protein PhnE [Agarivorans sp. 3_MG-2023]MDO6713973.1 phosphonate ABC transporter, permease protein PhnE [Agarivorans sp. 2_MG-2023]
MDKLSNKGFTRSNDETRTNFGAPLRFERPSILSQVLVALFLLFFLWSTANAGLSLSELLSGFPNMATIAGEMVPPATDRVWPMANAILVTFQMALVGTVIGIALSIPIAILAARNTSPNPVVRHITRSVVSFFRTVPDLAWALFFVASVGLGPFAGTLTIIVDTIGFCARFFAESMEEVDPGPSEALASIGASPMDRIAVVLMPGAMPSFINISLFSLEKAVRSSVVLGLVGAGGIGAELAVSMEMFRYDQAAMIVLMIFILVFAVEQFSSSTRNRLLRQSK